MMRAPAPAHSPFLPLGHFRADGYRAEYANPGATAARYVLPMSDIDPQ